MEDDDGRVRHLQIIYENIRSLLRSDAALVIESKTSDETSGASLPSVAVASDDWPDDVRYWMYDVDEFPPVFHLDRAVVLFHFVGVVKDDCLQRVCSRHPEWLSKLL